MRYWLFWLILVCLFLVAGDKAGPTPAPTAVSQTTLSPPTPTLALSLPTPTSLPVLLPTYASTPLPADAPIATSTTPSPTPTVSPTVTPLPTHPLMIGVMRQQSYPGSELIFEQTLDDGINYDRYIVSYLSESNKIYQQQRRRAAANFGHAWCAWWPQPLAIGDVRNV
ncbi:MAG: hypothetical protein HND44_07655 [Chloroflexi bacterium]|nr:hypothetical protein [Ardenticatenaceae bacterium]MBL1128363.1 hypothetical protein [Chloroflexota bacterium]NOG34438.1 hypothetical protein [Chloroflexota bacterium]GIK57673.1 MAG: hypothetical protein BroJett015_33360 [Chloroflexota bacterium]